VGQCSLIEGKERGGVAAHLHAVKVAGGQAKVAGKWRWWCLCSSIQRWKKPKEKWATVGPKANWAS
jgi:hypothetical protein